MKSNTKFIRINIPLNYLRKEEIKFYKGTIRNVKIFNYIGHEVIIENIDIAVTKYEGFNNVYIATLMVEEEIIEQNKITEKSFLSFIARRNGKLVSYLYESTVDRINRTLYPFIEYKEYKCPINVEGIDDMIGIKNLAIMIQNSIMMKVVLESDFSIPCYIDNELCVSINEINIFLDTEDDIWKARFVSKYVISEKSTIDVKGIFCKINDEALFFSPTSLYVVNNFLNILKDRDEEMAPKNKTFKLKVVGNTEQIFHQYYKKKIPFKAYIIDDIENTERLFDDEDIFVTLSFDMEENEFYASFDIDEDKAKENGLEEGSYFIISFEKSDEDIIHLILRSPNQITTILLEEEKYFYKIPVKVREGLNPTEIFKIIIRDRYIPYKEITITDNSDIVYEKSVLMNGEVINDGYVNFFKDTEDKLWYI